MVLETSVHRRGTAAAPQVRVQARADDWAGELLKEIKPQRGGDRQSKRPGPAY
jgi:hypothetical protein